MSRYVSFALLLTVIAIVAILFYKILAGFLIPLFLAALLVVIFGPMHDWMMEKCRGHRQLAALLTTIAILFVVLLPIGVLLTMAALEGKEVIDANRNPQSITLKLKNARKSAGLDWPIAKQIRKIESKIADLQAYRSFEELEYHQELWIQIEDEQDKIEQYLQKQLEEGENPDSPEPQGDSSQEPITADAPVQHSWDATIEARIAAEEMAEAVKFMEPVEEREIDGETVTVRRSEKLAEYHRQVNEFADQFVDWKNAAGGNRLWANLKMALNPDEDQIADYTTSALNYTQSKILKVGGATTAFLGRLLVGIAIMIIALYFFLLDGPSMIEACQGLSPMDDEHEKELVLEFGRVSRAVVVATLLSALVQGLLAGIGFYFVGFESIFLLTMLTTVLALVPFVGAAAVWVPACLYLYVIQNDLFTAIGLAVYGVLIISMADNVIKPLVLHGQSNLHPLLALLSVLGGVAAIGPVGILVGPMVVAFLQTLLKILQREMTTMETPTPTVVQAAPDSTRTA